MAFTKTYQDKYEDDIVVTDYGGGTIFLSVVDRGEVNYAALTPDTARKIAKALKQAANVAEGKPAKAKKKPRTIVDGDGDIWHLSPNGFYSLGAPSYDAERTPEAIAERYGLAQ